MVTLTTEQLTSPTLHPPVKRRPKPSATTRRDASKVGAMVSNFGVTPIAQNA